MSKKSHKQDDKISAALLQLAAQKPFEKITLEQIAKTAKITLPEFRKRFQNVRDVVPLVVRQITKAAFAAVEKPDVSAPLHDRLFEMLMARFDQLQKSRRGILSIMEAARHDPRMMMILLAEQNKAMNKVLHYCRLDLDQVCEPFIQTALHTIYLSTVRVWKSDETLDISKTMSALDRALRLSQKLARLLHVQLT